MRKFLLLILIVIGFAGCAKQQEVALTCDEAMGVINILTPDTFVLMNGQAAWDYAEKFKNFCNENVVRIVDDCAKFSSDEKDLCLSVLGVQVSDLSGCDSNRHCRLIYASTHTVDCNTYDEDGLKNACHYANAYFSGNVDSCMLIQEKNFSDEKCKEVANGSNSDYNDLAACYLNQYKCLWGVSDQKNDRTICDQMEPSDERDFCYFSYALKNSDSVTCDLVKNAKLNERCFQYVDGTIPPDVLERGILNDTFM